MEGVWYKLPWHELKSVTNTLHVCSSLQLLRCQLLPTLFRTCGKDLHRLFCVTIFGCSSHLYLLLFSKTSKPQNSRSQKVCPHKVWLRFRWRIAIISNYNYCIKNSISSGWSNGIRVIYLIILKF